ncbi:grass carp reovirus (GCRV)-induced 2i-like [Pelobates cultripes]|uniref:Grass carp reovirus (GCRV)-induced 2i-like n=1 Tax=Pelobates cultripes TaxID=61616 RepID=A0AAD1T6J5_PELCU|nr:grass carp reovirus (GCRV)-induced 2i-like [Pelobates cultripes]
MASPYYSHYYLQSGEENKWLKETLPNFHQLSMFIYTVKIDQPMEESMSCFRQSEDGMLAKGVYLSRDPRKAARYPIGDKSDQVILKLRVNVGRVLRIDRQGHPLQKIWHFAGYDTAWVPTNCGMIESGLEEECVWDPKRIKVVGYAQTPLDIYLYTYIYSEMERQYGLYVQQQLYNYFIELYRQ